LIPKAHKIPRIVWVIFTAGLIIGLTEGAVQSFYASLKNLINFIGYFSGSYVTVILIEFLYFRKGDPHSYDHAIWEDAKRLPPGIAATIATFVPWALIGSFLPFPNLSTIANL
jgi:purine-cytosine permease-like protein